MNTLAAYGALVLIVLVLVFLYGRQKGKTAENKVIREAFEDAGLARDQMDRILAGPVEPSDSLFDDWVPKADDG